MNLMRYLLEANLYLVAFYLLYLLLLRKETYYQLSRAYLLCTSALAFVIPLLQLGVLKPQTYTTVSVAPNITFGDLQSFQSTVVAPVQAAPVWSITDYCLLAYGIITIGLVINLGIKIFKLIRLSKNSTSTPNGDFVLVEIEGEHAAFSFFRYLFIDRKLASSATVINHEHVHIRQKHSWDIVYTEMLKVINWFNPVVYFVQNGLKELHEFIADKHTAELENSNDNYAAFLISNAYGLQTSGLTNSFSQKNMLRKRIIMLYQKRSGRLAALKYMLALPLICGLLCVSTMAFTDKSYGLVDILPQHVQNQLHSAKLKIHHFFAKPDISIAKKDTLETKQAEQVIPQPLQSDTTPAIRDTIKVQKGPMIILNGKVLPAPMPSQPGDKFDETSLKKVIGLSDIKASDISDISVLKDKAATALYGPAAANGVIIIRTNEYTRGRLDALEELKTGKKPGMILTAPTDSSANLVFTAVEVEPTPKNGLDGFYRFLGENIKYPAVDKDNKIQGRVIVQFIVEKDGSFSNIRVMRQPSGTLGEEAIRVLNMAPKWNPGVQNGRTVRVQYTIPINFSLADGDEFGAFYKQLSSTIKYPNEAKEKGISGRMVVSFALDDNKQIKDVQVARGISSAIDAEVIKAIKNCKALQNGKGGVLYTLPLFFSIRDKDNKYLDGKADAGYTPMQYTNNKTYGSAARVAMSEVVITTYANN